MKENLIAKLSMDFALRIVNMYQYLKEQKKETVMSKQVLRSGTSIGANIYESEQAQSKADFLSKLYIALKEANETKYWLELLHRSNYLDVDSYNSINNDLRILLGTLVNIIKKTKNAE
jgi:four helix bundle protein